jgi:hypothetical protein
VFDALQYEEEEPIYEELVIILINKL